MTAAAGRGWTELDPATHRPHALHAPERNWAETNCYVDLWIEAVHALGLEPLAMLPFTVAQDFEGDQFTFFKVPLEDLEALYGFAVQELAIYDTVEAHVVEQLSRGRLVLVEVDGFHLPDTRGTSYGTTHVKTTVGITRLDPAARRMDYFHNAGFYRLEGEDYEGLFAKAAGPLFPYVEFVKRLSPPLEGAALRDRSLALLRHHLVRRPQRNPIGAFREDLPRHLDALASRPMEYFHLHAFNVLRQLGANFDLLGSYAAWIDGPAEVVEACGTIGSTAKVLQFQFARAVAKRRFADYGELLGRMEAAYDTAVGGLARCYG
ncbi:DUF1839 family protein [Azospirillum thermophilum]|uniref:DUF1839 domain-containing protein n=1 Tax=Azospirillum thermophilum TaxID=2202148 RepID=A0A2S2CKQ0_9PROT|nr:DUF1839 family protein [Azospirillum thermophilum]AWK85074.1 DUF1839 domain-containing protein [Azospirillum thermophilum]